MMKKIISILKGANIIKEYFIILLLVIFFCSEAYGKIIDFSGGETRVQSAIKFIVFVYLTIAVLTRNKKIFNVLSIAGLCLCFCVGQIFVPNGFSLAIIILGIKYIFPLLLFLYFNRYGLNNKTQLLLFRVFEIIIIVNSILIIIGFLAQIPVFETYRFSRFGYNGLLRSSSTSSYFYILSLFYFLYKYKAQYFIKWKSIFVFIVCFIVGTKAIYLGLGAVSLAFLFIKMKSVKLKYLLSIFILGIFTILGYFLFFELGKFNQIRESDGIISSILSYRDQLFLNKTLPNIKENWTPINYFLGGFNDIYSRSQMDFIDIFHFWGILGGVLYIYTYFKIYLSFKKDKLDLFFIVFLIFIIFFAGNFFTYSTIPIYLIIIREKILKSKTNASYEHSNK